MTLTEKQTKQAQDLIEQYGFCTLETQKELAEAGFFEKVKALSYIAIAKTSGIPISVLYIEDAGWAQENEHYAFIPMPQMQEVWKQLPKEIAIGGDAHYLHLYLNIAGYLDNANDHADGLIFDTNTMSETEAMCQLWLRLHKEGLL